jgi:hypothetical protein
LLLNLHQRTAQLDSLIEVLKDLLLNAAHLIDLLTPAAGTLRTLYYRALLDIVAAKINLRQVVGYSFAFRSAFI